MWEGCSYCSEVVKNADPTNVWLPSLFRKRFRNRDRNDATSFLTKYSSMIKYRGRKCQLPYLSLELRAPMIFFDFECLEWPLISKFRSFIRILEMFSVVMPSFTRIFSRVPVKRYYVACCCLRTERTTTRISDPRTQHLSKRNYVSKKKMFSQIIKSKKWTYFKTVLLCSQN